MTRDNIVGTLHCDDHVQGQLSVGGVSSYNDLEDLPTLNGETIIGNMSIWQPKNFSTSEQNTGLKWIDGNDIYFRVVDTVVPNSSGFWTYDTTQWGIHESIYCLYLIENEGFLTNTWWATNADMALSTFRPTKIEMNFRGTYYAGRKIRYVCFYTKN